MSSNSGVQNSVVIFGATSAVAQALGQQLATSGTQFILCARDPEKLEIVAQDLRSRGAESVSSIIVDFNEPSNYQDLVLQIVEQQSAINVWYFFHGSLPNQAECESSLVAARNAIQTNLLSVLDLLHPIANHIEAKRAGKIVVVTSVAGDRGRASNYVYGGAKGCLSLHLQGIRNRLSKSGGSVLDVKPGFIRTPMTAHLDTSGFLWAEPNKVACDILAAVNSDKDAIYTPRFWRVIMFVICSIPERIFKRLSL